MRKFLLFFLIATGTYGQGTQIQSTTVAKLPNPANAKNVSMIVLDGNTSADCTTGGGANYVLCTSNGTTWTATAGGGGGGTPAGTAGQFQINDTVSPGTFGATPCLTVTDKTNGPLSQNCDAIIKGPDPYVDPRAFNVRLLANRAAIPAIPGITGSINNGSNSLSVSTSLCASQTNNVCFVNNDGIVVVGGGPNPSLGAAPTPTVTPSTPSGPDGTNFTVPSPAGGSTYNYKIVAASKGGGMTVAGTAGTTTTGQASLGKQTVALTSCARAGIVVTCLTAAPHTLSVGTKIYLTGISDGSFDGWEPVATVPDNTHFTYSSNFDTNSGASTSATGGSIQYKNENKITWTAVTNAKNYIVCSDRAGGGFVPIGISKPDDTANGYTDMALAFDDLGATLTEAGFQLPYWAGTNPCTAASPQNDELVTTITSGAPGTTFTLANAASSTVTNQVVLFDVNPNVQSAVSFAGVAPINFAGGGTGFYIFNSYVSFGTATSNFCIGTNMVINDTIELPSNQRWDGHCPPTTATLPSFAWESYPQILVGPAYPAFYVKHGSINFHNAQFRPNLASKNQAQFMVLDLTGVPSGTMENLSFDTAGGSANDYLGMAVAMRANASDNGSNVTMIGHFTFVGGAGGNGDSDAPLFYASAGIIADNFSFAHRGIAFKTTPISGGVEVIRNIYENGGGSPMVELVGSTAIINFWFGRVVGDTLPHPFFSNFASTALPLSTVHIDFDDSYPAADTGVRPPLVSGNPIFLFGVKDTAPGQGMTGNIYNSTFTNSSVHVNGTLGNMGYDIPNYTAPTCAVSGGGSVPVATWSYYIYAIDASGNYSLASPTVNCTTSGGNQTVTITPPTRPAGAVQWQAARFSGGGPVLVNVGPARWTSTIVDTFSFGNGLPANLGYASASGFNATELHTPQFSITGANGFKDTHTTATLTNDRTVSWPDFSGTECPISPFAPLTGQIITTNNAAACTATSAGIQDGNGGNPVTSTPYTVLCDSATTVRDRVSILRLQSGAAVLNLPDHTASGCGSNMAFKVVNETGGTVTVNRSGTDTITLTNGGPGASGLTTFTIYNGNSFRATNPSGSIWSIELSNLTYVDTTIQTGSDYSVRLQNAIAACQIAANAQCFINSALEKGTLHGSVNPFSALSGETAIFVQLPCVGILTTVQWSIDATDVRLNGCGTGGDGVLKADTGFPAGTSLFRAGVATLRNNIFLSNYRLDCNGNLSTTGSVYEAHLLQEFSGMNQVNIFACNPGGATAPAVDLEQTSHAVFSDLQISKSGANDAILVNSKGAANTLLTRITCNNTGFTTGLVCIHVTSQDSNNTHIVIGNGNQAEGFAQAVEFDSKTGGNVGEFGTSGTITDVLKILSGALTVNSGRLSYQSGIVNLVNDASISPSFTLASSSSVPAVANYSNTAGYRAGLAITGTDASGTITLTSGAVGGATCQARVSTAATNAVTTDSILWAYATAPSVTTDALLMVSPDVSSAGNVGFTRCNPTAGSITGTAIVINWRVVR